MTELEAIEELCMYMNNDAYCDAPSNDACATALAALREKLEREKNEALTLDELRGMDGEPVYMPGMDVWVLVNTDAGLPVFVFRDGGRISARDCYEADYIAYRRPPEE